MPWTNRKFPSHLTPASLPAYEAGCHSFMEIWPILSLVSLTGVGLHWDESFTVQSLPFLKLATFLGLGVLGGLGVCLRSRVSFYRVCGCGAHEWKYRTAKLFLYLFHHIYLLQWFAAFVHAWRQYFHINLNYKSMMRMNIASVWKIFFLTYSVCTTTSVSPPPPFLFQRKLGVRYDNTQVWLVLDRKQMLIVWILN